jgi:hypothetical protein
MRFTPGVFTHLPPIIGRITHHVSDADHRP